MNPTLDQQALNLAKSIGRAETGDASPDAYNKKGASGESGRYQFMPSTWKEWSKDHLGIDNAPMTIENQNKVAYSQVKKWKDMGLTPAQIASKWNSGRENAYKDGLKGTNNLGVTFNVPDYVKKVSQFYNESKGQGSSPSIQEQSQLPEESVNQQREELIAQQQPVSTNPDKAEPTAAGNFLRGFIRPLVRGVNTVVQPTLKALGKAPESQYNEYLGDVSGFGMKEGQTTWQRVKDVVGGAAEIAANFIPVGKGAQIATQIGKGFVKNAAIQTAKTGAIAGGLSMGGQALEQDKNAIDTLKDTAVGIVTGGLTGGTLGGGTALASKGLQSLFGKTTKNVDDLVKAITQGKPEDVQAAKQALLEIDRSSVKSYKDLREAADVKIKAISEKEDALFDTNSTKTTLNNANTSERVGTKDVSQNHVSAALNQLEDHYTTINDPIKAEQVRQLRVRAEKEGLTVKEINNIAREHGIALEAYNANGELASALKKQAFENTRQGIKTTARGIFGDEAYEATDEALSSLYRLRDLAGKMETAVSDLKKKVTERGIGAKLGRRIFQIIDTLSGGTVKGFLQAGFPSNVGLKTLNAIDLENQLAKNLTVFENILKNELPAETILQKLEQLVNTKNAEKKTPTLSLPGPSGKVPIPMNAPFDPLLDKVQVIQGKPSVSMKGEFLPPRLSIEAPKTKPVMTGKNPELYTSNDQLPVIDAGKIPKNKSSLASVNEPPKVLSSTKDNKGNIKLKALLAGGATTGLGAVASALKPKAQKEFKAEAESVPEFVPEQYRSVVGKVAKKYGIPSNYLGAILDTEAKKTKTGSWDPSFVNKGDKDTGIGQHTPSFIQEYSDDFQKEYGRKYDPKNAEDNIAVTALALSDIMKKRNVPIEDAIAIYHMGFRGFIDPDRMKEKDKYLQQIQSRLKLD